MILTGVVVFLFGTAVSAEPYIPHVQAPTEIVISKHSSADKVTEYFPSSGGSPFISNFIQKGTNVFFKPQFMLSAAQMPPQIQTMIAAIEKDDCKTTLPMGPIPMLMEDEPLRVIQQEIVASSKPIVKEIIEITPVAHNLHVKPALELTSPVPVPGMITPVVIEESAELVKEEHVLIPPAPELPVIELPKLPLLVEEPCSPEEVVEVSVKPQEIPEAEVIPSFIPEAYVRQVVISPPEAPVLPPYVPIEVPKPVMIEENLVIQPFEIPTAPTLPPFKMPDLSVVVEEANVVSSSPGEEIHEININPIEVFEAPGLPVVEDVKPIIPEAPVLSPYVPVEMPMPVVIEEPVSVVVENEIVEHVDIPAAPVLPPFQMPELPVVIEESRVVPCPPNEMLTPVLLEEPITVEIQKPVVIPSAPVLPPLQISKAPVMVEEFVAPCPSEKEFDHQKVVIESKPVAMPVPYMFSKLSVSDTRKSKPIIFKSAPEFLVPYFPLVTEELMEEEPTSCVHDIVVERILPKLEKSLKPKAAKVPVSAYLTPLRYDFLK